MAGNQRRKAPISVFLVAIMVTSVFAGVSFTFENANAAVDLTGEPSPQHVTSGDEVTFSFELSQDTGEVAPDSCTVEWNGQDITEDVSLEGDDGSTDCSSNTAYTATWTVDEPASTEARSNITVSATDITGSEGSYGSATTTVPVIVDNVDPDPGADMVGVEWATSPAPVTKQESALLQGSPSLQTALGPSTNGRTYTVSFQNPDGFLKEAKLFLCTATGAQSLGTVGASDDTGGELSFSPKTMSDLGVATGDYDDSNQAVDFYIEYTDKSGNIAQSPTGNQCGDTFTFFIDNQPPVLTLDGTPQAGLISASGQAHTTDHTLLQDTHFTTNDANGDNTNIGSLVLSWTGPGSNDDSVSVPGDAGEVTFPAGTLVPGLYDVELTSTDKLTNAQSRAVSDVRVDPTPPILHKVTFQDQAGDCTQQKVFGQGGESFGVSDNTYCSGPYDITIQIREEFPQGGAANPTEPTRLADTNLDFSSASVAHTRNIQTTQQDIHTWTYSGVDAPVQPVKLALDLSEDHDSRGLDESGTVLEFEAAGLPRVDFSPTETLFSDEPASFTMTDVTDENDECPENLGTNEFCAPGAASFTLLLMAEGSGGTVTQLDEFQAQGGGVYSADFDAASGSIRVESTFVRVERGDIVADSDQTTIVVDRAPPTIADAVVYEWTPATDSTPAHWAPQNSGTADIPSQGPTLVKAEYTSGSASEIAIRYKETNNAQNWVEYTFSIEDTGEDAGQEHEPIGINNQVVHLAERVPLPGEQTVSDSGCGTTSSPQQFLWGLERECYFLVNTARAPSTTNNINQLSTSDNYDVEVFVREDSEAVSQEAEASAGPQAPDASISQTPTLDPTAPQTRLTTDLEFQVSGTGDVEDIDSWVCLIRPTDEANPQPSRDVAYPHYFEGGVAQPGCTHPRAHDLDAERTRAVPTLEPTPDSGDNFNEGELRRHAFRIDQLLNLDGDLPSPTDELADTFYIKVITRDKHGNVLVQNYHSSGPGVFDIADYSVSQDPITFDSGLASELPAPGTFRDQNGCYGVDDGPCVRANNSIPPNEPFIFPVTLRNSGNVEDEVVVTWDHREGRLGWNVELIDTMGTPNDPSDDTVVDAPMRVTVPAPTTRTSPTEHQILVRVTPNDDAFATDTLKNYRDNGGPQDGFKTINLTVWSGNSEVQTPPRTDIFLQAHLQRVDRGSLLLGPDQGISVTQEGEPEDVFHVPVTIENTGNSRKTFDTVLKPALSNTGICNVGTDRMDDKINIQLETTAGSPVTDGRFLEPGDSDDLQFRVEIGRNVPSSEETPYRCTFKYDGSISTLPRDPNLRISVTGEPDVRILDLIGSGSNREEADVTSGTVTEVAPPGSDTVDVSLYLENNGTVAMEPAIRIEKLSDRFGLDPAWIAQTTSGTEQLTVSSNPSDTQLPFTLPVSDTDDPATIRDAEDAGEFTDIGEEWLCMENDEDTPSDDEDRVVCRIDLQVDLSNTEPVSGDQLTYRIVWTDQSGTSTDASTTFSLTFDHVGQVNVESVSERVLGTGTGDDTSTVTFRADLFEGRTFDLQTDPRVDSEIDVSFAPTGSSTFTDCGATEAGPASTSENTTSARFQIPVRWSMDTTSPCSFSWDSGSGTLDVSSAPGTLKLSLGVEDDQDQPLRTVRGAHVKTVDTTSIGQPNQVTQVELDSEAEMDANGTQSARFLFDTNPSSGGPRAPLSPDQGVQMSRSSSLDELEGFVECAPTGIGYTSSDLGPDQLAWNLFLGDDTEEDIDLSDGHPNEVSRPGQILFQTGSGDDERAVPRGTVDLYGWGTSGELRWKEGWNPVVFFIQDMDGAKAQASVSPDLELQLVQRNATGITDLHEIDDRQLEVRSLGGGFFAADVFIPEGFSQVDLDDRPADTRNSVFGNWSLRMSLNGQSQGGDDLRGDAYWSLSSLGLDDIEENGLAKNESKTDETRTTTRQEFIHSDVTFLPWEPTATNPWVTGPGGHTFTLFLSEERVDTPRTLTIGGQQHEDVVKHAYTPYENDRHVLRVETTERGGGFGSSRQTLEEVSQEGFPGRFEGTFLLPDVGVESFDWFLQMTVGAGEPYQTQTAWQVEAREELEPASAGLPMPLCLQPPSVVNGGLPSHQAGHFDLEESFSDRLVLDTRAVPGLVPDRGTFALTPFTTDGDGIRHDVQETFKVRGKGLLSIQSSELPTEAEAGVPMPLFVTVSNIQAVEQIRATLEKGDTTLSTQLTDPEADQTYEGSIAADELGTWTLEIVAEDVTEGVTVLSQQVEVVENAPPRIQVNRPASFDGLRAMQSGSTVEAQITNSIIAPEHITLLEKTGGDGGGVSGSPLAESDGVNITGIQDTVAPGSFSLTVNMTDALGDHNYTDVHGWLNVTDADGAAVDTFDDDLDEEASFSGSISLDAAGTYTLRAVGNNTTAAEEVVNTTFTVTVQETNGDFSEVAGDDYDVECETTTCAVRYAPSGLEGGQTLTLRYDVVVTDDDQSTNDTVIVIDDLDPDPDISIGSPSSGTTVSPSTLVEVSAGDNTQVDQLVVSGVADGTELGSSTVSGGEGDVSVSELGLTEDGSATIRLTATDIAGNNATETQTVTVDSTGPDLSDATTGRSNGDLVVRVTAEDSAGIGDVTLFFQRPGGNSFTTSVMQVGDSGDRYATTVSDVGDTGTFRYYIEATDALDNQESLASRNNPQTVELGDVPVDTNTAPEVTITSPADGDRVSGEITVSWEVSDAEGDSVSISGVQASPAVGQAISLTASEGQATLDTTQLAEGGLTITVDATDGRATGSDSIQVIVDNLSPAPACEADVQAEAGQDFEVCFELETESTVTQVELQYVRNGEVVVSKVLDPSEDGQYRTTVNFPDAGTYTPKVIKTHEDGTTDETTFETQSVAEAISNNPIARFIGMIVLAVAVLGVAGYAAFGRWN